MNWKYTHLCSINIQGHVETIVSGHQVSPGIGLVSLLAIYSGGFGCAVRAKREVEPCIFGAWRIHCANADRPALLTQWMGAVVKYTYRKEKWRLEYFKLTMVVEERKYNFDFKKKKTVFTNITKQHYFSPLDENISSIQLGWYRDVEKDTKIEWKERKKNGSISLSHGKTLIFPFALSKDTHISTSAPHMSSTKTAKVRKALRPMHCCFCGRICTALCESSWRK